MRDGDRTIKMAMRNVDVKRSVESWSGVGSGGIDVVLFFFRNRAD